MADKPIGWSLDLRVCVFFSFEAHRVHVLYNDVLTRAKMSNWQYSWYLIVYNRFGNGRPNLPQQPRGPRNFLMSGSHLTPWNEPVWVD